MGNFPRPIVDPLGMPGPEPQEGPEEAPPAGPPVAVVGFGRCGSTMLMNMLRAGGIPFADGAHPVCGEHRGQEAVTALRPGTVAKLLDPTHPDCRVPAGADKWVFLWLDRDAFAAGPAQSIDHAVMEHTSRACAVILEAGWSDVGSWSELWRMASRDAAGNTTSGDVFLHDSRDCLAIGATGLTALVGVSNLAVINTDDAVLVASLDQVQSVREIAAALRKKKKRRPKRKPPTRPKAFPSSALHNQSIRGCLSIQRRRIRMLRMLARNMTSNASPTNGTMPTTPSSATLPSIRATM